MPVVRDFGKYKQEDHDVRIEIGEGILCFFCFF